MPDYKRVLRGLVSDFVAWSKTVEQVNEWEANYSEWSAINTALEKLINSSDFREWNEEVTNDVLYLIARDNECESLVRTLLDFPECLIFLAQHGINYPDPDARWQLAHYLSGINNAFPEVEELIYSYYQDSHEYVKRRALLALGIIQSKYAESSAIKSWETGQEYQMIAALHVLYEVKSKELEDLLSKGEKSSFVYVKDNVRQIRERLLKK